MGDRIRLKVCGLRENVQEVAELCPNYIGFIFYQKSPRYVGEQFVIPEISADINKVGVFVNENVKEVIRLARQHTLDYVQLHGAETVDYCRECCDAGIRLIKVFAVEDDFDFKELEAYVSVADFFLFDTKTSAYGGSGKTFNWKLLEKYDMEKKYFLSGGISLENIVDLEKIDLSNIHALDVNSRFEVSPGLKDINLIKKLNESLSALAGKPV